MDEPSAAAAAAADWPTTSRSSGTWIAQAERRVLHGEPVRTTEKVVSLFEPHADVLVKDRRETY